MPSISQMANGLLRGFNVERLKTFKKAERGIVVERCVRVDAKCDLVSIAVSQRFGISPILLRIDADLQDEMAKPTFEERIRGFQQRFYTALHR